MTSADHEFVPFDHFSRLARFWWVVVLCGMLGGGAGLLIHRLRPPVYEAQAVFMASLDFNKIDFIHPITATTTPYEFSQYDEDISLALIESSLIDVLPQVVVFAQQNGIPTDASGLLAQATIERKHTYWELRYRSADPALAQKVANFWAQTGLADMKAKFATGQIPAYIIFDLIQIADLPKAPAYFQTNSFVLAGGVLGLIAGLLALNLPLFGMKKER